jgi:hypothetical protein
MKMMQMSKRELQGLGFVFRIFEWYLKPPLLGFVFVISRTARSPACEISELALNRKRGQLTPEAGRVLFDSHRKTSYSKTKRVVVPASVMSLIS